MEPSGTKEQAEEALAEAQKNMEIAKADLRDARAHLDEFLALEEAERRAVYLGFDEGDEAGIRAALHLAQRNQQVKAEIRERENQEEAPSLANLHTESIGGVS